MAGSLTCKTSRQESLDASLPQPRQGEVEHLPGQPVPTVSGHDPGRGIEGGGGALPRIESGERKAHQLLAVEDADAAFEIDRVLDHAVAQPDLGALPHLKVVVRERLVEGAGDLRKGSLTEKR